MTASLPIALFAQAWDLWGRGGALMIPLAVLAFIIYWTALDLYYQFNQGRLLKTDPLALPQWVENPCSAATGIREILEFCQLDVHGLKDLRDRFQEVHAAHIPRIDRRIHFLAILVSASPLMGLLGTVMGMLATFDGLTTHAGRTIDLVAAGISEALITTQTGLMVAIPGLVMLYLVQKRRNHLHMLLVRLESLSMQTYERHGGASAV
jgi:biopolymer transport protein ExbB